MDTMTLTIIAAAIVVAVVVAVIWKKRSAKNADSPQDIYPVF
jgi:hypothetical protein